MKEDFLGSYPMLDFKGKPNAADELVCFQEAQTLGLIGKKKPLKFFFFFFSCFFFSPSNPLSFNSQGF